MNTSNNTVYIVDDDAAVRDALGLLLSLHGFSTAFFADGAAFLNACSDDMRGCLLLDIRMPGIDGLALQKILREKIPYLPVIIITGHGDVDSAREAFRARAVDFLEKPLQEEQLVRVITEAFERHARADEQRQAGMAYAQVYETLTPREREVLQLVVSGRHNREVAETLGISVRTAEVHKARIMDKLRVANSADLVRLYLQNEFNLNKDAS
jgi:RNA polymerase sigma factor (sigma-70 family)